MRRFKGFTVIELIFVVALLVAASILFFTQKNDIEKTARDNQRKTAINAMYYSLEEVYYPKNKSYPRNLNSEMLPSVDDDIFIDPGGIRLGQTTIDMNGSSIPVTSNYSYEGLNCKEDACKNYILKTTLENEDDFIRKNRH